LAPLETYCLALSFGFQRAKLFMQRPIMILHFIGVHNYLPPAEFIAAIDAVDEHIPFVADEIYREQLRLSDWGQLSGEEKMDLAAAYIKRTSGAEPK
jgi:hypothetical protein